MRKVLSIVLVVIAVLSLFACGGKQEDKEKTVKVVVAVADFQIEQGSLKGIQMALDEVNGKVGSTHIEIVNVSTSTPEEAYSPDKEVEAAQMAAADKNVIAYIGMITSRQARSAIPILNEAGIASLSFSATWPGLTKTGFGAGEPGVYYPAGTRTFFRIVTSDEVQGAAGAYLANELGFKKACLLDDGGTYGAGVTGIFDLTANDLGLEVVCHEQYDASLMSVEAYADVAGRVIAANPDVVYLGGNSREGAAEMIAALRQQKSDIPLIGADGLVLHDELLGIEGLYATDVVIPADQLGTQLAEQFIVAYEEKYGAPPQTLAVAAYESMRVVLRGIDKAGKVNRAGVVDALHNLGEYSGTFGIWSFDQNGDTTLPTISIWQIQNGEWRFVDRSSMHM